MAGIDLRAAWVASFALCVAAFYGGTSGNSSDANRTGLQAKLTSVGGGITVLDYMPGQDTNAFVVRKETADQFSLTNMSSVGPHQNDLKWALATDCPTNPLCAAALQSAYGLAPTDVTYLGACSGPMAAALLQKTVDVAELCSTGPEITTNGWVVLADDKQTQPADNIAPLVRNDLLAKVDKDKLEKALNDVSAKIDTKTLAQLYYDVTINHKDLADVAKAWLTANGFAS